MEGCVVGMHNLKNKTIFDNVKVSSEFPIFRILIDIPSSFLRPNPINHSTEVKTTPTFRITANFLENFRLKNILQTNATVHRDCVGRNINMSKGPYFQTTDHRNIFCTKHQWSVMYYSDGKGYVNQTFFSISRSETPPPLFSDPVSSYGAKTIPTHDTILSITINDHDKHLMIITIPNNIPTSIWMPLEIHSSARWHPQTYIFIKSKYLYQLINYSDGSSRTNQTFFFIMKYENSSPISSDSMQSDNITILAMDNITLNIDVDNEHSDLINITVLSTSLVRKLGAIGKTYPSSMAPLNFHLYQIESFYFYGA